MRPYAFGVDVGGTTVKMGFFHTSGELLEKWELPTRTENGGEQILPDIAASVREMLKKRNLSMEDVEGIGIGVPGAVRENSVVDRCVNLGWGVVPVRDILSSLLDGCRVMVGNDANVAALGEIWKGGGEGARSMVMVTLGTGIGGGIILDGKILNGAFGAAGEIGHICINEEEDAVCGCGKKGHLEQYASANGIAKTARKMLDETTEESSLRALKKVTSKDVFDAAKRQDKVAVQIVERVGQILGKALAAVACVVDPEVFVIGGGVSKAGAMVTDVIRKYFVKYAFHASEGARFELARLGNDAGIYGAVRMLM